MKKRMYHLVIYQLSGIQAGIQAGHCAQQYDSQFKDDPETWEFVKDHKTWYVLNGGTTKIFSIDGEQYVGSLNKDIAKLVEIGYKHAIFREPDLGDQITACCFICDERVFNRDDYPDFSYPQFNNHYVPKHDPNGDYYKKSVTNVLTPFDIYEIDRQEAYQEFVKQVGIDVATLKEIIKKPFHN